MDFKNIAPWLGAIGQELIDLDENKTGAEDFAGALLVYAAEAVGAIEAGTDLPEIPEILKAGTGDKITGAFRATLKVANGVLAFARFQFGGEAGQILKYINQSISQLLAGQPVPAMPAAK